MHSPLSRKDFLKLSGLALGGLAFSPFLSFLDGIAPPQRLIRVATQEMPVYEKPSFDSQVLWTAPRDTLLPVFDLVQAEAPSHNPYWYQIREGYMHRGRVQTVRFERQSPPSSLPAARRFLAEVTVPLTAPYYYTKYIGWVRMAPPLYYRSLHWVEAIEEGPAIPEYDGPWYRIHDELDSNIAYFVPAAHLRLLPDSAFAPISPDVPYKDKFIEVDLARQILYAYEHGRTVLRTSISSGLLSNTPGANGIATKTPAMSSNIMDKVPSKHMGRSYFDFSDDGRPSEDPNNYILPGVPWSMFFSTQGHAFHGVYWHENFGTPLSSGCINMRSDEANWLFRWAVPVSDPENVFTRGYGTQVDLHY